MAVKKTTSKAAAKTPSFVQETYFQIDGEEIKAEDIVEKVKEAYKNDGHRVGSIKTMRTYVNVPEHKAYYVINDNAEDKFVEF